MWSRTIQRVFAPAAKRTMSPGFTSSGGVSSLMNSMVAPPEMTMKTSSTSVSVLTPSECSQIPIDMPAKSANSRIPVSGDPDSI
jgi:hypothetical protein